jgi:hypothetical protein
MSSIHYPDYKNLDVFFQKETRFWGERMGATIRFETLNATNSVVFGAPNVNANNIVYVNGVETTTGSFGNKSTSQTNDPRQAQLSARFTF